MSELYENDLAAWAEGQVAALRRLAELHPEIMAELDVEHLVDELDDMRKSLSRELTSRLAVVLTHLATWRWQPGRRTRSWENSVGEQRDQLALLLEDNPSLRPHLSSNLARAWTLARRRAHRETGLRLDTSPDACPFTVEQALDDDFLPN